MTNDERERALKFEQLCRMTDEHLNNMTPQARDRMLQAHLAQARGSIRNGDLLRQMTDAILILRAAMSQSNGGK